jgi:hypothetical protein
MKKMSILAASLLLSTTTAVLAQYPVPEKVVRANDSGGVVLQWAFTYLFTGQSEAESYLEDWVHVFLLVDGKQKYQFFLGRIHGSSEASERERDPKNANDLGGFQLYWAGMAARYQLRREPNRVIVERIDLDEGDQGVTQTDPETVYRIVVPAGTRVSVAPSVQLEVPAYSRLLRVATPPLYGQDVFLVQALLMETPDVDGFYGKQTEQAVREYQAKSGLEVDGVVGPKTWKSLTARIAGD